MARPRKVEFSRGRGKHSHGKWWAWVDLNHGPRPYQGSVVRFYDNYKTAGTAKTRGSRTRHRNLWVGLWVTGRQTPSASTYRERDGESSRTA